MAGVFVFFTLFCLLFGLGEVKATPCEGLDAYNVERNLLNPEGPCVDHLLRAKAALEWHRTQLQITTDDFSKASRDFKENMCKEMEVFTNIDRCFRENYPVCWSWSVLKMGNVNVRSNMTDLKIIFIIVHDDLCNPANDDTLNAYWGVRSCNRGLKMLGNYLQIESCQNPNAKEYIGTKLPEWFYKAAIEAVAENCIETSQQNKYYNITESMGRVLACTSYGLLSHASCQPYLYQLVNIWKGLPEKSHANRTISHTLEIELIPTVIEPTLNVQANSTYFSATTTKKHKCQTLRDGSKAMENRNGATISTRATTGFLWIIISLGFVIPMMR